MENDRCTDGPRLVYPESLPPEFLAVAPPAEALLAFCSKWRVDELSVWGRTTYYGDADQPIRMVVRFRKTAAVSSFMILHMEEQLSASFGRGVQLMEEAEVTFSANLILRQRVLASARTLYRS
ncbi:MAG: hypothetical protein WD557_04000 [Dehalococcoidia bacterium]